MAHRHAVIPERSSRSRSGSPATTSVSSTYFAATGGTPAGIAHSFARDSERQGLLCGDEDEPRRFDGVELPLSSQQLAFSESTAQDGSSGMHDQARHYTGWQARAPGLAAFWDELTADLVAVALGTCFEFVWAGQSAACTSAADGR